MRVRKEHEGICEDLDIQLNMAVGINLNCNFQIKCKVWIVRQKLEHVIVDIRNTK